MTTHLYLIRHADALEGEQDGKYSVDLGLSPEGRAQAEKLRDRLIRTDEIKADAFIVSPLRRAQETAQIIAPALNQPIRVDDGLQEWRTADSTISPEEFMSRWEKVTPSQKAYFHWVEGDESRIELGLRVHVVLNRLIQAHLGKTLVILSHGAFLQMSFQFFFGYGDASLDRAIAEVKNTSITHWYQAEGQTRWILERSNDYHHLIE